ncbi:hypothetical protein TWF694_010221 [Orbilia ellipsospora]|uniref:Alpha-ketoglutarate-dependent dioxygenase AlkB-like domain-containing protein n=1 Tax=Orbilia ellipsospora TaxID=2528407 RepID=A0AAV9X979_9PEZI
MSFQSYSLSFPDTPTLFPQLLRSVRWETFSKNRQIAIIHRPSDTNNDTPLVRTTTAYQTPSQPFSPLHDTIISSIREVSGIENLTLNHAMMEIYDSRYTTMGFHTDQALDLAPDSYICLFSSYEHGADEHARVLTVKNKESGEEFVVELSHHSVVIFSTEANRAHVHKIEAKDLPRDYDNRWMGVTLRLAKSFVRFVDNVPVLVSGGEEVGELMMATDRERGEFYRHKGMENRESGFEWPGVNYTISPSDRMAVTDEL